MDRLRELARRLEAEVRRNGVLEGCARAATVLAARRGEHRGQPQVVAAAPVARDLSKGGETRMSSVGRDTDAVDPGAARDRDAPASLGARAQDGEGVVADVDAASPAARLDGLAHRVLLGREVNACEQ